MKIWYHSHLCGFSFCNVLNHINVDFSIRPNGDITSRFNIVFVGVCVCGGGGGRGRGHEESLNGKILMCQS